MTASLPSASRFSSAINDLEDALSALDQTVNTVSQSLSETAVRNPQNPSAANPDMMPAGQFRKELAGLQELVSGAAELIALARSGKNTEGERQQETH